MAEKCVFSDSVLLASFSFFIGNILQIIHGESLLPYWYAGNLY